MAQNASNDIRYFLVLEKSRKDDLAAIRQWNNLKVAFEGDYLWIKDFNFAQIHSSEVKSMPFKTIYDCKQGKLYLREVFCQRETCLTFSGLTLTEHCPLSYPLLIIIILESVNKSVCN